MAILETITITIAAIGIFNTWIQVGVSNSLRHRESQSQKLEDHIEELYLKTNELQNQLIRIGTQLESHLNRHQ